MKKLHSEKNEDLFLPETLGIFHAAIELFCWILTIGKKKKPTKNLKQPPTNRNGIDVIVRKVPSNEFDVPQLFQFYIYKVTKYWFCNYSAIYYRTKKIKWQQHNLIVFK